MKIYISLWFQPITQHYASGSQARVYSPSRSWVLMWVPPHSLLWPHGTYTHNELKSQFSKNWLTIRVFWFSSYKDSKYLKGHGSLVRNGIMWRKHIINWIRRRFIWKKTCFLFFFFFFPHLQPVDDINICFYVVCSICFEPTYWKYSML